MYEELASLYEDHCADMYHLPGDHSSFESEDSTLNQNLYLYESNYSESTVGGGFSYEEEFFTNREDFSTSENPDQAASKQSSCNPVAFSQQKVLPGIVSSSDMQWITSSCTDVRIRSPSSTSSKSTSSSVISLQSKSYSEKNDKLSQLTSATTAHSLLNSNETSKSKTSETNLMPAKPKGTPGRKRKYQDHELSPAEAARRHVRRERNKLAAAKCRNRRRELTDRLQGETDHLEDHQQMLQREIIALKREKTNLEYILASHSPNCKAGLGTADMKTFHQQYADLAARQDSAIDLSTVSSYHAQDNAPLAENNDSTLPYLKKCEEMLLSDPFSTPLHTLPISIPHPFHFRHQQNATFNSAIERQRNDFRRQSAIDFTNQTLPATCPDQAQPSNQVQNYQADLSPKHSNLTPYHSPAEDLRMKPNLSYQGSGATSDSEYSSVPVNPHFTAAFPNSPLNLRGRPSQQVCSFDHLQHIEVNSRQSPGSVTSPKHLLAL